MRKFLFAALVSTALLVAVPATALARHHHRHHHHATVRHEQFGSAGGTTTTSGDQQEPAAGTVESFSGGVLTIRLADNTTLVSGMVTNATELKCEVPETMQTEDNGSDGGSGDQSSGDNSSGDGSGDNTSGEDQGGDAQMCTTANLTHGTVVQDAELQVSSAGAVWDEVELVTP